MKQEKMRKIRDLIDKELLKGKYLELSVHKKILIAQMIDKIELIVLEIKNDDNKCAISECSNTAIADILHDDNSGAIPLCAKHLISYTKDLKNYLLTQF